MTNEKLEQQDMADIGALLQTREGARFLSRLLDMCGVFRLSYAPGDTHLTAFREGQRNIGNALFYEISQHLNGMETVRMASIERNIDDIGGTE